MFEQKENDLITFPYVIHESDMAREERKQRRLWIALVLETFLTAIVIFKGCLSNKQLWN